MSMKAKQTRPERCYCRIQDDEENLDEIAKIITVLNGKIVQLRNEVSALKNGDPVVEKLFKNTDDDYRDLRSRCCKKEFGTSRSCVNVNKPAISEESKALTDFFGSNLKEIDNKIRKDTSNVINFATLNEKAQTHYKPTVEILKRKKISRGVQCNSEMEHKRKHFLNCFKNESNDKEEYFWKPNKKPRLSTMNNFYENFDHAAKEQNYTNAKKRRGGQLCQLCENYAHDEKLQRTKIFENELAAYNLHQQKNLKDERQLFEHSINRMIGGAEIRGNRLISDFGDKMQRMNLYKNVKFNARNVKKRLDACIIELNEIIEDVSLILPKTNICKEKQK